jgi:hypothetical protein
LENLQLAHESDLRRLSLLLSVSAKAPVIFRGNLMSISLVHSQSAAARLPQYNPSIPSDFLDAVQAAMLARSNGVKYRHQHAKVAEAVLIAVLPMFSNEIRMVGSRKGSSGKIGKHVATHLGGSTAAALAALWSVRNARLAGIDGVFRAAAHKPGFGSTMGRILGQRDFNRLIRRIGWHGAIRP